MSEWLIAGAYLATGIICAAIARVRSGPLLTSDWSAWLLLWPAGLVVVAEEHHWRL